MHAASLTRLVALSIGLAGCGAAPAQAVAREGRDDLDGQTARTLFANGEAAAKRGDNVRAEQYLELAAQRGYDQRRVLPLLLSACLASMHLRAALDHAESYLRDHPGDENLRYLVATIRIGLGQGDAARFELERLLRHNPDNAGAHFLLGVLDADVDVESAREHLRRYLAADPDGRHAAEAHSRLADLTLPTPSDSGTTRRVTRSPWSTTR